MDQSTIATLRSTVARFVEWLDGFGEISHDHQSYFAGGIGARAKSLYYRHRRVGTAAVAPMILSEAFVPGARRLFWRKMRFPIADAHYAMGFALLMRLTGHRQHYDRAVRFLGALENTRCEGYRHYCWGYPFDWVTQTGVMPAGTPLITTAPYCYEAFAYVHAIDDAQRWLDVMQSVAEHAATDIMDRELSADEATAGYNPFDTEGGVVNASAYRAWLLVAAAARFSRSDYREIAERNLNFVLRAQRPDGSWPYAVDKREFVDHFHTCFVLKAIAKIDALVGHEGCRRAIEAGVDFYVRNLFDIDGLPKPFASAPRLTVYRRELYDYAECINLGALLYGQFDALDRRLGVVTRDLLERWRKDDGSFRSRQLLLGWDNVPMHRWAQSQAFRALCALITAGVGKRAGESEHRSLRRVG